MNIFFHSTPLDRITKLRTLDVSTNDLKDLSNLAVLSNLKTLNCDDNKLVAGSLAPISGLSKLQNLSIGGNQLGKPATVAPRKPQPEPIPPLPASLKQLKLDSNFFMSLPLQVVSVKLMKLEKLDLSRNNLAAIPVEIANLVGLSELNLDSNVIVSLPDQIGSLKNLKSLSIKHNKIGVLLGTVHSKHNPQPLPKTLFVNTPVIDLNLHGNQITSTQLNDFDGFDEFLARRQKIKTKDLFGGALTDLDLCGLH